MTDQHEVTDSSVFTAYSWFQSAMLAAGRKINFPKCSDKTKTYQFRWTKAFVNRCYNDLGIDDKIMKALVYDMVIYAKSERLLNKGTQILSLANIADICFKSMSEMMNEELSLIREIRSCHQFINDQLDVKDSPVRILKSLNEKNGIPNIVHWYDLGHITDVYIALSKPCIKALNNIQIEFRSFFPSNVDLLRTSINVMSDKDLSPIIQDIMGKNLRVPRLLRK